MSVLIKGMEMPEEGNWITLRVYPDGQCFLYSWRGNDIEFIEQLTAVPVQEPHGDLIDRDALRDNNSSVIEINRPDGTILAIDVAIIDAAPTVIPASEEGEA